MQFAILNFQSSASPFAHPARGVILLIVLVIVAMLSLGAYSFTSLMNAEAQGAKTYGRIVQAREAADSGVHYVAAMLANQKTNGVLGADLYDSSSLFQNQTVSDESVAQARLRAHFSIVAPILDSSTTSSSAMRYGLSDEAGRLNLNAIQKWLSSQQGSQTGSGTGGGGATGTGGGSGATNPLLNLPNMTAEIADAILDWIDSDDTPRDNGAESDYYMSLDPPYHAKNGPLDSLDELLLVRGVTPRLLYGEDANRNGMLDANEDDGEQSPPSDDANGQLSRGWLPYLTLHSREPNTDTLGETRINLSGDDLDALYSDLSADAGFGADKARFIVAYRLFGPTLDQGTTMNVTLVAGDMSGTFALKVSTIQAPSGGSGGGASGGNSSGGSTASAPTKVIADMDASNGSQQKISSIVDLIGATVTVKLAERDKDGQAKTEAMKSPFTDSDIGSYLDGVLDRATTVTDKEFIGRVNVNTAPSEVLLGVPGLTEDLVNKIANSRPQGDSSSASSGLAWLLSTGALTKDEFKKVEPYLTGRSLVYRVQSVGHFEEGGPVARIEAVIDVSGSAPRIRSWVELTPLGRGFDPQVLSGAKTR